MASKQISPAAQLFRHSKLFSVPTPIRSPVVDVKGSIALFESDSATQHLPTHASIISTHKGRQMGDWGLKRNLPLRKTVTRANPIIQVRAVDNIDHVTDYEAGTPHTITLRKFQELGIPVSKPEFSGESMRLLISDGGKSVFDVYEPSKPRRTTLDISGDTQKAILSSLLESRGSETAIDIERWKFRGPWLAGMDETAFQRYLKKEVTPNRAQFKKFVWSWMQKTKTTKLHSEQLAMGTVSTKVDAKLTEDEYQSWLVQLRHEGKQLYALMWEFLDLPGRSPSEKEDQSIGPPQTHPSAGLSYLKTENILQNHPALGPMAEHQPVMARVLQKATNTKGRRDVKGEAVGVAGIVSDVRERRTPWTVTVNNAQNAYGDKKIHVVPSSARIDEQGRINIDYKVASKDSVAVWESEYDAEEHVKADKEVKRIVGFSQKPASLSSLFSSLGKRAVT